jgi:hypothetical protein
MHELEYRGQRGMAFQAAVREKEEALIQSALGRIARARAKGKTNVNLSEEEMEALQRRNNQQPEPAPALASPPPTPAKNAKGTKTSSRSSSSTNLAAQKTRKRNSSGLFGNGSSSPAKSNSKAKVNRKPSAEQQAPQIPPYPPGPPGILVPGPDGVPVYAPIGYGPPSPEFRRQQSGGSQPGSRSASKHRRRESTPPERTDPYAQYPMRYYPPPSMRPPSSGSNRSLPDDVDWYPPAPRTRSSSNAQYAGYATDHDVPLALPAAQSRRNVSGPADMRYSSLRRVPAGSPLAARPGPGYPSYSDPAITGGKRSGLSRQVGDESSSESSSSSGEDDEGVQVEIMPDDAGGYTFSRTAIAPAPAISSAPASGNEARKRKGGRK